MLSFGGRVPSGESETGVSAATERLRSQIKTVGPHFRRVLVTGERGARKEEVARSLHAASPVSGGPFVVCDAGSMESLRKGVRGGAGHGIHEELRKACRGGTIFFPELGLFLVAGQAELMEFLDRLGEEKGERIRVIASVSGDVQAMVAGGTLRSDLRDRMGVIEMAVAPLRERLDDVAAVAARILEGIAAHSEEEVTKISTEALRELQRRGWPGNDRELESALRMAVLASGGEMIEEKHLPPATVQVEAASEVPAGLSVSSPKLQDVVEAHVQEVLRRCEGNKLKAAEVLGISRSTLYRMLDAVAVSGRRV